MPPVHPFLLPLLLPVLLALAPPAAAELQGPILGAASNFGQGWQPDLLAAARALGVRDLRDAVYWSEVERRGAFTFDRSVTTYPDAVAAAGMDMSLTVNNGHPDHDGGATPYTRSGIAAFARDAAETVARFPAIDAVEVGNEFNSANFVTGPVRNATLGERAAVYAALLKATHDAVKAVRPGVRVLGGGVHSIPGGYLGRLFALGAAADMDALALHPYSTAPEQFARQIAVLRRLPNAAAIPIEVTEFGTADAAAAPGFLMRYYCQMALAGVTRAVWYPLSARGDGLVPLIDAHGAATATGRAYATVARLFEGRPAADAAPDPFTYACRFGDRALVIWGAPRALRLARADLRALDPTGAPRAGAGGGRAGRGALELSETDPIVVTGSAPFTLGTDVTLGPQRVIADSYDQFAYPGGPAPDGVGRVGGVGGGFDRFIRAAGRRVAFETHPGQDAPGRPWTPYLAAAGNPTVRLQAGTLLPGGTGAAPDVVVQSFSAPREMTVTAEAHLAPATRSRDGVTLAVTLNGAPLYSATLASATTYESGPLHLARGDVLSFAVGPNGNANGDVTAYRITLRKAGSP